VFSLETLSVKFTHTRSRAHTRTHLQLSVVRYSLYVICELKKRWVNETI